jgi:hypothetical protein
MTSKNGNVRREGKPSVQEIPQFQTGDVVSLTAAAIRRSGIANMTPRLLYEIGHPNEFVVFDTFESDDGPCVSLLPCCSIFEDRENGKQRCTGHPAIHFQKKSVKRMPKKGDKSSSIHLPFMQVALAGINWEEDESNPSLKAHVLGKEVSLTGPIAKILKQLAEENNVL